MVIIILISFSFTVMSVGNQSVLQMSSYGLDTAEIVKWS